MNNRILTFSSVSTGCNLGLFLRWPSFFVALVCVVSAISPRGALFRIPAFLGPQRLVMSFYMKFYIVIKSEYVLLTLIRFALHTISLINELLNQLMIQLI